MAFDRERKKRLYVIVIRRKIYLRIHLCINDDIYNMIEEDRYNSTDSEEWRIYR